MIDFTLYDLQTGRITGGGCHPDTLPLHAIEGNWCGVTYYIADGKAVRYPPRPSDWHTFDFSARRWVLDREAAWAAVRRERDARLKECDWTTFSDVPLDEAARKRWAVYRQALRDMTDQSDPLVVVWPAMPEKPFA